MVTAILIGLVASFALAVTAYMVSFPVPTRPDSNTPAASSSGSMTGLR